MLLNHENLQQIIKLILLNSFVKSEPALTQIFQILRENCSTLFNRFLSKSEKHEKMNDENSSIFILINNENFRPAVSNRIKSTYCRNQFFFIFAQFCLIKKFSKFVENGL